jgi:hypothetical protein
MIDAIVQAGKDIYKKIKGETEEKKDDLGNNNDKARLANSTTAYPSNSTDTTQPANSTETTQPVNSTGAAQPANSTGAAQTINSTETATRNSTETAARNSTLMLNSTISVAIVSLTGTEGASQDVRAYVLTFILVTLLLWSLRFAKRQARTNICDQEKEVSAQLQL